MKHYRLLPHCKSDWPLSIHYYAPFPCHEPPHDHDCYEIMIVLNGSGWCRIGDRRYPVLPGMVFLIQPGEPHEYQIPLGTLIFNIMFSPDIFSAEAKAILVSLRSAVQCPAKELDLLKDRLLFVDRELTERQTGYQAITASILTELLVFMSRGNWDFSGSMPPDAPDALNTIISYVSSHYRERITLTDLGKILDLSPAYVGQFFRRCTWKTLNRYVLEIRIAKARSLLESTTWSAARVAAETGFFDSAHFIRAFRRITGMTPGEYVRSLSKKHE